MRQNLSTSGKLWVPVLWVVVSMACFGYVFYEIYSFPKEQLNDWVLPVLNTKTVLRIFLLIGLMAANWGIEALKWKLSFRDIENHTFGQSFKATLAGLAISTWMPNRMGEYLGKVFFVKPENRLKGAISALYVSYTQIIATLFFGFIGLVYIMSARALLGPGIWFVSAFAVVIGLLIVGYHKIKKTRLRDKSGAVWKWLRFFLITFTRYGNAMHGQMILLSAFRYTIFTLQYVLVFYIIGEFLPIVESFLLISVIYGLQTLIPASAIASLGIRGSLAIYFLSFLTPNTAAILTASYGIWLINLLLPSIPGFICLLTAPSKGDFKIILRKIVPIKLMNR